jgi:hypothetical protein
MGIPNPTFKDLIINRTFDGLSLEEAGAKVLSQYAPNTGRTIAPKNVQFIKETIQERVRQMQAALSNVYLPGSPPRKFLESFVDPKSPRPVQFKILGSMTSSGPIVYQIKLGDDPPEYYQKGESRDRQPFVKVPTPPQFVVMEGEVSLSPPGLLMKYPAWDAPALVGDLSTFTEL